MKGRRMQYLGCMDPDRRIWGTWELKFMLSFSTKLECVSDRQLHPS